MRIIKRPGFLGFLLPVLVVLLITLSGADPGVDGHGHSSPPPAFSGWRIGFMRLGVEHRRHRGYRSRSIMPDDSSSWVIKELLLRMVGSKNFGL